MTQTPHPRRPIRLASLKGETAFRRVRAHGQLIRTALFSLRVTDYRPRYGEPWRPQALIGIVVSKKTLRLAVDRNRARRRVREALRGLPLPACRAMLLPNPAVLTVSFAELQATLGGVFSRLDPKAGRGNARRGERVPARVKPTPDQQGRP